MNTRAWWIGIAAVYIGALATIQVATIVTETDDPPSGPDTSSERISSSTTGSEVPRAEDEQSPAPTGGGLYEIRCASCHGLALDGGTGPDLGRGSEAAEENDGRLLSRIRDGRGDMPGFSDTLSEEEIELVLDFLRQEQGK